MNVNITKLIRELRDFQEFGAATVYEELLHPSGAVPVFINEFWTSKQRAANSLHEISYRACFKPQLPRFFIDRLTKPGDVVYDPFMGRGTTLLEAALLGRKVVGCDINPLGQVLLAPRLSPPSMAEIEERLNRLDLALPDVEQPQDLLVFYHPETLHVITSLRAYFIQREADGKLDLIDAWIRMVATNRLTGHSPGFFSVYTMPPNQAVTAKRQAIINEKRNQVPPVRDVKAIILKKSRSLLKDLDSTMLDQLRDAHASSQLMTGCCDQTPDILSESVNLVVTSPPFLDVVDYKTDNWLRGWFNGVDSNSIPIWQLRKPADWVAAMARVFVELHRVLVPGGFVAFEVGDIRGGKVLMETLVVEAAQASGLQPELLLVNAQEFTKTSNCWGVSNQTKGTNTNRVILLRKV